MKRFKKTAIILSVAMLTMGILSVPAFAEEPAPASETAETVSIGFGSTGEEVANIQTALIAFGFLDSVADGDFGNVTKAAVEAFQQAYGLEVTGTMTENDIAVLTGATSIVPAGGTQPTGEPADRFGVGLATICIYPDGTMWAEPDTVSNRALDTVDQILLAVTAAYNGSDSIPEYDTGFLITIAEGETGVPEVLNGKETVSLDELAALAAITGESITLTDNLGNVITAQPDGTITSSTGVIAVAQVRMDTNEVIQETAGRNIEDLNWKNPNELWIGGTKLVVQEDGTFTADPNTVSKQTLDKVRALYSAGQYAFANSETIPADESEIDPANLPDGLTEADVAYNDATGGYYVRQDAIDRAEQETGTKIELPNTSLVTPTRFDQSGQTSQEEEQAKE